MKDVTGTCLAHQVHPDHAGLDDEVIDWYDASVRFHELSRDAPLTIPKTAG